MVTKFGTMYRPRPRYGVKLFRIGPHIIHRFFIRLYIKRYFNSKFLYVFFQIFLDMGCICLEVPLHNHVCMIRQKKEMKENYFSTATFSAICFAHFVASSLTAIEIQYKTFYTFFSNISRHGLYMFRSPVIQSCLHD